MERFVYVGFWKRVLASLVDGVFALLLYPLGNWVVGQCFLHRTLLPDVAYVLAWQALFLFFVIRLGATPGKLCIGARIVDKYGKNLTLGRAMLRFLPYLVPSIPYLVVIYKAIHAAPVFETAPSSGERLQLMIQHGGLAHTLSSTAIWFVYADGLVVAFNKKKRAIHDFIAGSYVVTRRSLIATNGTPEPAASELAEEPAGSMDIP